MRYSYEYKRKCVDLYREGKWPDVPEGITEKNFKRIFPNKYFSSFDKLFQRVSLFILDNFRIKLISL